MELKLKNAGFKNTNKSRKKALIRMIKGQVFYSKENAKLYFDLENGMNTGNYFMLETRSGAIVELMGMLDFMNEWQVEDKETVEEKIDPAIGGLCWVDMISKNNKRMALKIKDKHTDGRYIDVDDFNWKYATRLTNEELEAFKQ